MVLTVSRPVCRIAVAFIYVCNRYLPYTAGIVVYTYIYIEFEMDVCIQPWAHISGAENTSRLCVTADDADVERIHYTDKSTTT